VRLPYFTTKCRRLLHGCWQTSPRLGRGVLGRCGRAVMLCYNTYNIISEMALANLGQHTLDACTPVGTKALLRLTWPCVPRSPRPPPSRTAFAPDYARRSGSSLHSCCCCSSCCCSSSPPPSAALPRNPPAVPPTPPPPHGRCRCKGCSRA